MPSSKSSKKSPTLEIPPEMISFTQTLTKDHYKRLMKLMRIKGMQYPQDLVRVAVADLLEKTGF